MKLKSILQYVLFLGIGFIILYLMYRQQSLAYLEECTLKGIAEADCSLVDKFIDDFKEVNWFWISIVLVIFMLSNILRALRWNQLLNTLNYYPTFVNSLGTIMLGYFANLGLPRIGEFVRSASLSKYENIPLEQTLATIVIGRIIDVILLLSFIGLAFILAFDILSKYFADNLSVSPQTILIICIVGIVVGIIGLYVLYSFTKVKSENKIIQKASEIVRKFLDGIESVLALENKWLFIFYSLGIWICYYLMTYLCFFAYEPTNHLGPVAGLVIFVFGALGIVFPSPGGMGSYHYLVTQALIIYGLSSVDAFSFAMILFFAIQLFCNILFGLISLIVLPIYNR